MRVLSYLISVLGLFIAYPTAAQQDPLYAQYLNNPLTINPAYAGINNQFSARIQYRTQWAGLEANPRTFNFSTNSSFEQNKMGLGLMVMSDKLGDIHNLEVSVPVSYKIKFKEYNYLSFGMQVGFLNQRTDLTGLNILDPTDEAFKAYSETAFNLGTGIMLRHDKGTIGLSVPRLLPATINTSGAPIELYNQHYYLFGSYHVRMNDRFVFKPSVLLRGTKGTPLSTDINTTVIFNSNYAGGIFTRNFKTYGALIQVLIQNYHLGYVFELPGSKDASLRFTSHEITLGISRGLFTYHDILPKGF